MGTLDLHMHSTASDGSLTPEALVRMCAHRCGVRMMALTDHDTVAGIEQAQRASQLEGIVFVPGIELSTLYAERNIHIVGLGINHHDEELLAVTTHLCAERDRRAVRMAERFAELGFEGMFEQALSFSPRETNISRLHFAKALIERGIVKNQQEAFDRYLGEGKPAYVAAPWGSVADAVALIHRARGLAVLAHPGRYQFKADWQLDALVEGFAECGGDGIEVVSGSQSPAFTQKAVQYARFYGLAVSSGSDFHSEAGSRPLPGMQGDLPSGLHSVVKMLGLQQASHA